jgi:hypothetical protein
MHGDSAYTFLITILAIALFFSFLVGLIKLSELRKNHERALSAKDTEHVRALSAKDSEHSRVLSAKDAEYAKLAERMQGLTKLVDERKIQFPWLASAIADFDALGARHDAWILEQKKRPAMKAADVVREHGRLRRNAESNFRRMRYRVEYYEKLFPWIIEYVGDDVPDSEVDVSGAPAEATDDPVKDWLNDAEYQNLSVSAANEEDTLADWTRL